MKKTYIIPEMNILSTQVVSMLAMSMTSTNAEQNSEVLSKEDYFWGDDEW